jgi:hypothetical protein
MNKFFYVLLLLFALITVASVSYLAAAARYRSEITRLKGEASIYRSEADKYSQVLRGIRETATAATVAEKAY